ncbi:hypothetical protein D3C86_2241610 [compost metagenome]
MLDFPAVIVSSLPEKANLKLIILSAKLISETVPKRSSEISVPLVASNVPVASVSAIL